MPGITHEQQRLADYPDPIIEGIERIDHYTADIDELAFLNNPLVQDAVIRNVKIIGEASNNIEKRYPEFALKHPELPLSFAYQMRNAVARGYSRSILKLSGNQFSAICQSCIGN